MPAQTSKAGTDDDAPVVETADGGTAAADAAVAEVDAKASDKITATHAGVELSFTRKRLDSVQFRRLMQRNRDIVALEYLLGPRKVDELLDAMADDDGDTDAAQFAKVFATIGEAVGSGNS